MEPPSWWIGFKDTNLQLMLYGQNIAALEPTVDHGGVTVVNVLRTGNPNYLFVYLDIAADAAPGDVEIALANGERRVSRILKLGVKNPDPAHAAGFSSSDAIYLITPDRFANGNPANDNVAGMDDAVDRSKPGGRHGGDIEGIADSLVVPDRFAGPTVGGDPGGALRLGVATEGGGHRLAIYGVAVPCPLAPILGG
jgi:hypothetical protein